jgi:hypothetical protein
VKPSNAANDNLIDRTRAIWQPRLGRDLSREDARQITEDVTGFFSILEQWSRAEIPTPANDNSSRAEIKEEKHFEEISAQGEQGRSRP